MANANAAATIPFALTPAEVDNDPINYRTTEGGKLFKAATAPLATKFNGQADKFFLFLNDVTQHAEQHNWGPILQVPNDANAACFLLEHCGELSEGNIHAHALTTLRPTHAMHRGQHKCTISCTTRSRLTFANE